VPQCLNGGRLNSQGTSSVTYCKSTKKSGMIGYILGGAMNRGLKWVFSKNRPSFLIEAFGSPEKGWLLCVDLLQTDLFDIAAIFRHGGLQAAAERAADPADVGRQHPVPLPGDGPA
jgi:hypothetical protein